MKKILIVDNDRIILHFLDKKLSKRGYHVVTTKDGISALDILETYTPNIIFVDLIMPNIDGIKLCKIIRSIPKLNNVFLIVLSAISAEDEINIAELGADAYVAKGPPDEMSQNIFAILDQIEPAAMQNLSSEVVGITSISPREITKELLFAKRHSEIILEKISQGVVEITPEGRIIYLNSTALSLIGIPESNLLGSRFVKLFARDDRKRIAQIIQAANDANQEIAYDSPVILNEHQVTLNILPFNKEISTQVIIINNITEQKRTEDAIRDGEERYRTVLESSPDPVVVYDMTGRAMFVNPAFTKVFGWNPAEVLGQKIEYVPQENLPETSIMIDKVMAGQSFSGTESRRLTKKGSIIDVSISGAIYRDHNGVPQGCVVSLRDITENKKLQAQLQHAQKMESIGTIASGVAHNFKNILTGVSVHNQLLEMKCQNNSEVYDIIQKTNNYVKWGSQLVAELMQFSHRKDKKLRALNLSEVIRETYQLINQSFDKNIHIHLNIPDQLPFIGNNSRLSQVFMNLCLNARDAMPAGGELHIEAQKDSSNAIVTISDTGHGMNNGDLLKCFDPFFTTKDVGKGTGLGLSTAYGIVKDHGGDIQVDSEPGKGTIFKLFFPITPTDEASRKKSRPEMIRGNGQKILIVNDELEILKAIEEFLEELGYRTSAVTSGKDAVGTYSSWQPDAVLLETNMPEMDGIECAKMIAKDNPDARIIFISISEEYAMSRIDDEIKTLIKGFLAKPFDLAQLSILLSQVLE